MSEEKQERTAEQVRRDKEILNIFDVVTKRIKPAADRAHATDVMSTHDFMQVMSDHYPGMDYFTSDEMYNLLLDNDYKYTMVDDAIVWLVKKV